MPAGAERGGAPETESLSMAVTAGAFHDRDSATAASPAAALQWARSGPMPRCDSDASESVFL